MVQTFKRYLTENRRRVEVLKEKFKDVFIQNGLARDERDYDNVFSKIVDSDPTGNKQYLQWILKLYAIKNIQDTDLYKITEWLEIYEKFKRRLPSSQRDINRVKKHQDLWDIVKPFQEEETESEKSRKETERIKKDVIVVYKGREGGIYIPQTEEASCYLGQGTTWCTAATRSGNAFSSYHSSGNLFIFIPKGDDDREKYQFHGSKQVLTLNEYNNSDNPVSVLKALSADGEFMDSSDRPVNSNSKIIDHPLTLRAAADSDYSGMFLGIAVRFQNRKLFNVIKRNHMPLLRAFKADAEEILTYADQGALSQSEFKSAVDVYRFVHMNL